MTPGTPQSFILEKAADSPSQTIASDAKDVSAADYVQGNDRNGTRINAVPVVSDVSAADYKESAQDDPRAKIEASVPLQDNDDEEEEEDELLDLFATEEQAPKKKKSSGSARRRQRMVDNIIDNWDDAEGYYSELQQQLLDAS